MPEITFEPLNEIQHFGDRIQHCSVFVDGKELNRIIHRTFFPYNFLKNVSVSYIVNGFDCLDGKYEEKLIAFKAVAEEFGFEVIECETIFFDIPESESVAGDLLKEIEQKVEKTLDF